MYYLQGAGSGWDAEGNGTPSNFHHVGLRLDYAVASNLNVSLVGAYAWRDQPWAYVLGGDWLSGSRPFTNELLRLLQDTGAGQGNDLRRPVPDSARGIGWEVDLRTEWMLLENLTLNTSVAYWKPGNWWGYAFPNTAEIYRESGNNIPVADVDPATRMLGRDVDAIFAVESSICVKF